MSVVYLDTSPSSGPRRRSRVPDKMWKPQVFNVLVMILISFHRNLAQRSTVTPPHVLLVLADDYGWSDVGFHGSKINTPNIDRLASEGVILDNYYIQPICTPTRGALMTGKYPVHLGLQHDVIHPEEPWGLPLDVPLLPQKLKEAGYATHLVGKWHLGFFQEPYIPTHRGFDSFYGYYDGEEDYVTHEIFNVLDFRDGEKPERDMNGTYSVFAFMEQIKKIVSEHNPSRPLFLYVPFQSVHSPVEAPQSYVDKYSFIEDKTRRIYAGMVDIMDEAVGNITRIFKEKELWDNTLMIFSTDNGGIPMLGGYNWPLRGIKHTLWEGGVRGVGFVHGKMLDVTGVRCKELLHITDWYPTLLSLAGVPLGNDISQSVDGFNVWGAISQGQASPRQEILHNIDLVNASKPAKDYDGAAIRVGHMKLLQYVPSVGWIKPPELENGDEYVVDWYKPPEVENGDESMTQDKLSGNSVEGQVIHLALFNITADPEERVDLSKKFPDIAKSLQARLEYYRRNIVPPLNRPSDPSALETAKKNGVWGPWK